MSSTWQFLSIQKILSFKVEIIPEYFFPILYLFFISYIILILGSLDKSSSFIRQKSTNATSQGLFFLFGELIYLHTTTPATYSWGQGNRFLEIQVCSIIFSHKQGILHLIFYSSNNLAQVNDTLLWSVNNNIFGYNFTTWNRYKLIKTHIPFSIMFF